MDYILKVHLNFWEILSKKHTIKKIIIQLWIVLKFLLFIKILLFSYTAEIIKLVALRMNTLCLLLELSLYYAKIEVILVSD